MPEPITKWFKPVSSDIQQTAPSEAPKALQIEERFEKLESALVHPFKSIENIERYMERLNILMERLEADNLIRRQFDDTPISIGATVTYQLTYNRHLYAYLYSNTGFTLQVSTGATQVIPANYWTNVSYPRGSYFTVVNGSDVTLQNCVVRTCDVPMEMATQQVAVNSAFSELSGLSAGSLNAFLLPSFDTSVYGTMVLQTLGTWSGTLTLTVSNDNATWVAGGFFKNSTGTVVGSLSANDIWIIPKQARYIRVQMTSYASGTATGILESYGEVFAQDVQAAQSGAWFVGTISPYPNGATQQNNSANGTHQINTATLTGSANKFTWLTGFEVTNIGTATAGSGTVTVTGVAGGPLVYEYDAPGVASNNEPLIIQFSSPLQSSAVNTNITVACSDLGASTGAVSVVAHGFTL